MESGEGDGDAGLSTSSAILGVGVIASGEPAGVTGDIAGEEVGLSSFPQAREIDTRIPGNKILKKSRRDILGCLSFIPHSIRKI